MRFGRGRGQPPLQGGRVRLRTRAARRSMKLGEHLRLHPVVRGAQEPYRYEREVEDFLRWSPHVKNTRDKRGERAEPRAARRAAAAADELRRHGRDGPDATTCPTARPRPSGVRAPQERRPPTTRLGQRGARPRSAARPRPAADAGEPSAGGQPEAPVAGRRARRALRRSRRRGGDRAARPRSSATDLETLRDYERDHANRAAGDRRDRVRAAPGAARPSSANRRNRAFNRASVAGPRGTLTRVFPP